MTRPESLSPRKNFEHSQQVWLAGYAVGESHNGGRKFSEGDHDYRSCFQRDRDRVIHCSAFRRLDFKTQVFVPHEHDHFRTRLTHTIEVAQIARDIGRALRLNEDLIETVALAHDLGHPPFGHSGEAVLDELMSEHGHFEHNRQSLRVVDYLEHPYPRFRGLNLTHVVRECIAKHETRYDSPICEDFDAELGAPLEGQIVDLADEIAYTSADLEDSLASGWITTDQLAGLELWNLAMKIAETGEPDASEIHKRIRACKAVLAVMADDLISSTVAKIKKMNIDSLDTVRKAGRKIVGFSDSMRRSVDQMQNFLLNNVYLNPRSHEQENSSKIVISSLFESYLAEPKLLPQRYQSRTQNDGLHRVICDYIAGMTDRFCKNEHKKNL